MAIARVFPRRTQATPHDSMAWIGHPDLFVHEHEITEVHVSVAFTWDLPKAQRLADAWDKQFPGRVQIGGPATGTPAAEFIPGRYLRAGHVITSRGCPRKCWFCRVPKVEGALREYTIHDGWCVQDDNVLACSQGHFERLCEMLSRQNHRAEFKGGLEALLLQDWHVDAMAKLTPLPMCFFAYDPGDSYEHLADAATKMLAAGWTRESHRLRCYVLIGWPRDSMESADVRLKEMLGCGFTPMAMLWRNPQTGLPINDEWRRFQRRWARPAIIHSRRV